MTRKEGKMLFFRADSNVEIASGHIMRCLSIAEAGIEKGFSVHFLVADKNPIQMLEGKKVPFTVLNSNWRDLNSEIKQVIEILTQHDDPILVVDTYQVTKDYVDILRQYCKVIYLGSKRESLGRLNLLINYSTDIDYEFYEKNYENNTTMLLGPSFAPLRKEFQNKHHNYLNKINRLLVTTGNTDNDFMVMKLLKTIVPIVGDIIIDVIIGKMFKEVDGLRNEYKNFPNVVFHENVKEISHIMEKCDAAISANGTTIYELSALGVPTISFAMVEEQTKSAEALARLGIIDYCGRSYENQDDCIENIKNRLIYYLFNSSELASLGEKAHEMIDGNGCKRIIEAIENL